jgi:peroxiredoxin
MLVAGALLLVAATPLKDGYELGDKVADFKLKSSTDGKMVSLSDYSSSKGVILIFDCNTCPYSQRYNSRIIALNDRYASKGFPVVTVQPNDPQISPGDSFDEMSKIAKQKKYAFPYLFDEQQTVSKAFGATNTPHVFLLRREGKDFTVAYIGAIDDNVKDPSAVTQRYLENAVDALLAGKPIETKKTKALGCTIKWSED